MARSGNCRSWRLLAAACLLLSAVISCSAAGEVDSRTAAASGRAAAVTALQLNLCDSGIASCYTGRSVAAAAAVIRDRRPEIVTVDEVCRPDVFRLKRAMSAVHRGSVIASAFEPAVERPTGSAYRCRNGKPYGIGVLAAFAPPNTGFRTYGGRYPIQDLADPEERVWLCIHEPGAAYACATHTASTSTAVALAQCRYLLTKTMPHLLRTSGTDPVVLGADLNLPPGHRPDAQSCLARGWERVDDGSRQDVMTSGGLRIGQRAVIDMHGTTDHPGLLVDMAAPAQAAGRQQP